VYQLAELLRREYGLDVQRMEPERRGWTAHTYVATTSNGLRLFVKLYPRDRLPPTAIPALAALAELHSLIEVPRPIASASGAWHAQLEHDTVVVFEHVHAKPVPFAFGGEWNGELVGRVHQLTDHVTSPVVRETFEPWFADELWRTLARARAAPAPDQLHRGLHQFVDSEERRITEAWARFAELASDCRAAHLPLALTHGDWPFNLLEDANGRRYLVDWDELLLAPPERDTWFANNDAAFWQGYRSMRPGYVENELATAYYLHHRYFEELVLFAKDVLSELDYDRRASALELLNGEWMTRLRQRMR